MTRVKGITHITFRDEQVRYWLETTDTVVHYDSNKVTGTASFVVTCKQQTGNGAATDCSDFYLALDKYNGQMWISAIYTKRASLMVPTGSNFTRYRVRALNDSDVTVCEINVEAIFDGEIGPAGAKGAIYLCRGEWNNQETYIKTAAVVHYVIHKGYAYEPKVAIVIGGNNPLADVQAGGANWKSLGRYDVIATRVLLANFALIAGAVFWDNKLMSQYGTNNSGAETNDYTGYSEDATGNETGAFHPNLLIDFSKGQIRMAQGGVILNKDGSGQLAGGAINWNKQGNPQVSGVLKQSLTIITPDNYTQYAAKMSGDVGGDWYYVDWSKCSNDIKVEGMFPEEFIEGSFGLSFFLPEDASYSYQAIKITNAANFIIGITGWSYHAWEYSQSPTSTNLPANKKALFISTVGRGYNNQVMPLWYREIKDI
jgi:hypothetical protein